MKERRRRLRQWMRDRKKVEAALWQCARDTGQRKDLQRDLVGEALVAVWLLRSSDVARARDPIEMQVEEGISVMRAWLWRTRVTRRAISLDDLNLSEEELACSEEQAQSSWPVLLRAA